jgi:hypothetical protein
LCKCEGYGWFCLDIGGAGSFRSAKDKQLGALADFSLDSQSKQNQHGLWIMPADLQSFYLLDRFECKAAPNFKLHLKITDKKK